MLISDFFEKTDLNNSLLLGYYGGGNFGDELLLEVISHKLKRKQCDNIHVRYSDIANYKKFHHDFGYKLIDGSSILNVLKSCFSQKNIIVGGGGFWGLDANSNVLLMSMMLFLCRYILFKRIYIIGVGYYSSTGRSGHIAAYLAGKSANVLIVRDKESVENFRKYNVVASLDKDIAFQIDKKMTDEYEAESNELAEVIELENESVYITLRKFRGEKARYNHIVSEVVKGATDTNFLVGILQPAEEFPEGNKIAVELSKLPNVKRVPEQINPLALMLFLSKNTKLLKIVSPQFHIIVVALISEMQFMPVAYDNKVSELLSDRGVTPIKLTDQNIGDLNGIIVEFTDDEH